MSQDGGISPPADFYPPVEPYDSGFIEVDNGHQVYWEMCGNPTGKPVLFLHGGPGGGATRDNRRLFDPDRYRIILFDQRGGGRSRPLGSIEANTTAHLLADMERIRRRFCIERWQLCGGSWGTTLALAYAQTYPERVSAMVLRGVFTARRSELHWLYRQGASLLFPDAWERFIAPIPQDERDDLVAAYHARLMSGNRAVEMTAARSWCAWEQEVMTAQPQTRHAPLPADDAQLLALARIETHYFVHGAFLAEGQLIANAHRLFGIPGAIVQGRFDTVTPPVTALDICRVWPQAKIELVPDAGHATSEPGILHRLIAATNAWA